MPIEIDKQGESFVPRRWKQNRYGDNFRPSSDANHRSKSFYSHRQIPGFDDVAAAVVVGAGGDGGIGGTQPCSAAAVEARNAEAASFGAALPWQRLDTAQPSTAAAAVVVVAVEEAAAVAGVGSAPASAAVNRSRWIASYLIIQTNIHLSILYGIGF